MLGHLKIISLIIPISNVLIPLTALKPLITLLVIILAMGIIAPSNGALLTLHDDRVLQVKLLRMEDGVLIYFRWQSFFQSNLEDIRDISVDDNIHGEALLKQQALVNQIAKAIDREKISYPRF